MRQRTDPTRPAPYKPAMHLRRQPWPFLPGIQRLALMVMLVLLAAVLLQRLVEVSHRAVDQARARQAAQALQAALVARGLKVTRLARGVPAGSELEYVDLSTIAHAMGDRR